MGERRQHRNERVLLSLIYLIFPGITSLQPVAAGLLKLFTDKCTVSQNAEHMLTKYSPQASFGPRIPSFFSSFILYVALQAGMVTPVHAPLHTTDNLLSCSHSITII